MDFSHYVSLMELNGFYVLTTSRKTIIPFLTKKLPEAPTTQAGFLKLFCEDIILNWHQYSRNGPFLEIKRSTTGQHWALKIMYRGIFVSNYQIMPPFYCV